MNDFSLLVKPASADCNLKCNYCFYLDKKKLYPQEQKHRMSEDTLERLLQSYFAADQELYSLTWQGGEPCLMGADFFKRVTELQKNIAPKGSRIVNCIQTNATKITPEIAEHMARYRFLAGCSIDGPAAVHDLFRKTAAGKPTHAKVVRGIKTFTKHGVPVNAVCLISSANVDHPGKVYDHLKSLGFGHIQFIPCLQQETMRNEPDPGITGIEWGKFLLRIFDQWFAKDVSRISIRNFESILAKLVMGQATECRMADQCGQYLVVEYNGDVYPCDFYVQPGYRLGNILEDSFAQIFDSSKYLEFSSLKSDQNSECAQCTHLQLCQGDCPGFRSKHNNQKSVLCEGWKYFYDNTTPRFMHIARVISG